MSIKRLRALSGVDGDESREDKTERIFNDKLAGLLEEYNLIMRDSRRRISLSPILDTFLDKVHVLLQHSSCIGYIQYVVRLLFYSPLHCIHFPLSHFVGSSNTIISILFYLLYIYLSLIRWRCISTVEIYTVINSNGWRC